MSAAGAAPERSRWLKSAGKQIREFGMPLVFTACILATALIHPNFGSFDLQSLALGALPLAMAAAAQAIVVISGGIDLSVGSMIAVSNVLSARLMQHASFEESLGLA